LVLFFFSREFSFLSIWVLFKPVITTAAADMNIRNSFAMFDFDEWWQVLSCITFKAVNASFVFVDDKSFVLSLVQRESWWLHLQKWGRCHKGIWYNCLFELHMCTTIFVVHILWALNYEGIQVFCSWLIFTTVNTLSVNNNFSH